MEIIDNSTAQPSDVTNAKSALFRKINLNVDIVTQAEMQEIYNDLSSQIASTSGSLSDYYTKAETYNKTEVDSLVSTQVAAVISGAPETFDTLKEVADWISADETGTAALVGRVTALEQADTTLSNALTAEVQRATTAETGLGERIDGLTATYKTIADSDAADTAIKNAIADAVNDTRFATDAADDYTDIDAIIADLIKVRKALGTLKAINS